MKLITPLPLQPACVAYLRIHTRPLHLKIWRSFSRSMGVLQPLELTPKKWPRRFVWCVSVSPTLRSVNQLFLSTEFSSHSHLSCACSSHRLIHLLSYHRVKPPTFISSCQVGLPRRLHPSSVGGAHKSWAGDGTSTEPKVSQTPSAKAGLQVLPPIISRARWRSPQLI